MTGGRKSHGIVEVIKGPVDLRVPPNTSPDRKLVYGMAVPFQVAEGKAALAVSIREDLVKGVDFENGADVVLFDDLSGVKLPSVSGTTIAK